MQSVVKDTLKVYGIKYGNDINHYKQSELCSEKTLSDLYTTKIFPFENANKAKKHVLREQLPLIFNLTPIGIM